MDWAGKEYYANKFQPVLNDPQFESSLNIIFYFSIEKWHKAIPLIMLLNLILQNLIIS